MIKIKNVLAPLLAIVLLACSMNLFAETANSLEAPGFYIDTHDPCPFECCSYGEWTVKTAVPGYDKPDIDSKVIGYFREGNVTTVTNGEMHVYPGKFIVHKLTRKQPRLFNLPGFGTSTEASKELHVGDTLYLYTYEGEGYYKIWFNGDFYVDSLVADGIEGEITVEPKSTWWVYATSPLGWSGWTNKPYAFGNNNQCPDAYPWNVRVSYIVAEEKIRSEVEMIHYKSLYKKIKTLESAEIFGNGYTLYGKPNAMYIDVSVNNLHTMQYKERYAAIRKLAARIYQLSVEAGIEKQVQLAALCISCPQDDPDYVSLQKDIEAIANKQ